MHKPNEFARRFADRLAEREYTDRELIPADETSPDAVDQVRRVRETPPPYGEGEEADGWHGNERDEAPERRLRRPPASAHVRVSDPSAAPARRRPR
jgi:hypothetical protein